MLGWHAGVKDATARLKRLLTAKDHRQEILDMAAANQIDTALLQLLQQNIESATAAKQADAAAFMTKVRDASARYVIVPDRDTAAKKRVQAAMSEGQGDSKVGGAAGSSTQAGSGNLIIS
jgi:hypothetical protein